MASVHEKIAAARKVAKVVTPLQPHQQRVVDRIKKDDQPGLVVVHGLGSGKTLTSIAAHDALGEPGTVVVPAALQGNYAKELDKHHVGKRPPTKIVSLQGSTSKGSIPESPVLIVDEAHRIRDTSTKGHKVVTQTPAKKKLLLTATPFYNHPSDIAPLVNYAAGTKVMPTEKTDFENEYVAKEKIKPGFIGRLMGVKPGEKTVLNPKKKDELAQKLDKWVDYYEGSQENFPEVKREDVHVPMGKHQAELYKFLMDQAPMWVRYKVKKGLPPSKTESSQLNAFLGAVRQVSNSTRPYTTDKQKWEEPKIEKAFQELQKHLGDNPRAKAVIYSNFINAGLEPYKEKLRNAQIPFGEFSGQLGKAQRDQLVKDYNENKLKALLISSAGAEGLDLKGTRLMQIMDPHWNMEKIRQVEGRGARYKSHAHLPPEEQKLLVQRYLATKRPSGMMEKIRLADPGMGVDEYMANTAEDKDKLNQQFRDLLKKTQAHS
jgi:superfamily II DNA or RNA helicase